jgi:hypothetical protein
MSKLHYSPQLGRLARCTSDKCPYEHFDPDTMKRMAPVEAMGAAKLLKNSYLGVELLPYVIAPALNQLRSAMSPGLFDQIVRKKAERDGEDHFHMTVITPPEYRRLMNEKRFELPSKAFRVQLEGVGTASNERSQTWFAVAHSTAVDHYRYSLGLPRHDLHITLGFTEKDVHGVKKDASTLL